VSGAVARLGHEAAGLTDEFWLAAADGRLVRPVCADCGRSFFTPRWICPYCRSDHWSYQPSTGHGRVYSSTVVYRGPDESWEVPYVLAIIDLDEGWNMLSRLLLADDAIPDASVAGRAVSVRFVPEDRPPFRTLPVFALTGSPS
jgi:uncharacterized OB-fold protein